MSVGYDYAHEISPEHLTPDEFAQIQQIRLDDSDFWHLKMQIIEHAMRYDELNHAIFTLKYLSYLKAKQG